MATILTKELLTKKGMICLLFGAGLVIAGWTYACITSSLVGAKTADMQVQERHTILRSKKRNICAEAEVDFRDASKLFVIVAGMEHSGTTMLSQLIMSAPNLYGGFECGILMSPDNPAGFEKVEMFYRWMMRPAKQRLWGLTKEIRDLMLNATCFAEMYETLHRYSPLFHLEPNTNSFIVDKTPQYIHKLVEVMDRTPGVPVIVTRKSDEDYIGSLKYRGWKDATIKKKVDEYKDKLGEALEKYPERIYVADTSGWLENPDKVMKEVFDFLNLEWRSEYLTMEALNAKGFPGGIQSYPFSTKKNYNNISKVFIPQK